MGKAQKTQQSYTKNVRNKNVETFFPKIIIPHISFLISNCLVIVKDRCSIKIIKKPPIGNTQRGQ